MPLNLKSARDKPKMNVYKKYVLNSFLVHFFQSGVVKRRDIRRAADHTIWWKDDGHHLFLRHWVA